MKSILNKEGLIAPPADDDDDDDRDEEKLRQQRRMSDKGNRPYGYTNDEKMEIYVAELETANRYFQDLRQLLTYVKSNMTRQLMYDLLPGEVYEVDFGIGVGSELRGRHYAVVVRPSLETNQIVEVVPLKTMHKANSNPTSDVEIGPIPGLMGNVKTIAVFNQKRGIDKLRIYRRGLIRKDKEKREFADHRPVAVLTKEQMDKILNAIKQTTIDGKLIYSE